MVELCPADTEFGVNETVTPLGCPVAVKLTVCALPEVTAVLMVLEPEEPCWTERLAGLAVMEKSLVAGAPQLGNLKEPMRVFQLNAPFAGMYSVVYQKVQSSTGSTAIME